MVDIVCWSWHCFVGAMWLGHNNVVAAGLKLTVLDFSDGDHGFRQKIAVGSDRGNSCN